MCAKNSFEKKKYLTELNSNQLRHIRPDRRLVYRDLCRVSKYISSSIFDDDNCCIWDGYVTNAKNTKKGTYINFFFRNKKVALHRLLYENFVGPLGDDYYLKFSCDGQENRGRCCNVKHMMKYKYNIDAQSSEHSYSSDECSNDNNEPDEDKCTLHFD